MANNMWLVFKGRPTYTGDIDILSGGEAGSYWVDLSKLTGTLPATAGYGILEVIGFEPNTSCVHKFYKYSVDGVVSVYVRMFTNSMWLPWTEYKSAESLYMRHGTYTGNIDNLNTGTDNGTYWVDLSVVTGTKPAASGFGVLEVVNGGSNAIHKIYMHGDPDQAIDYIGYRLYANNRWYPWRIQSFDA